MYDYKYEVLKNNYDVKMDELEMTKMHNNKLLSITSSSFNNGTVLVPQTQSDKYSLLADTHRSNGADAAA